MRRRKRKRSRVRAALVSGARHVRRRAAVRSRALRHAVGASLASLGVALGQIVGAQAHGAQTCATVRGAATAAVVRPADGGAVEGRRLAVTLTSGMVIGGQTVIVRLMACGSRKGSEDPAALTVVIEASGSLGRVEVVAGWRAPLLPGS